MKFNILILIVVVLAVSACSTDKRQRLSLAKRNLGRDSVQTQEKMSFAFEKGCLNLEALMKFYKRDASQAGRITVRDITTGSAENDDNILPALIKERPLELALTSVANLDQYFPLKIIKQTECESVEIMDADGKIQTLRIEKNREVKKTKMDSDIQVNERRRTNNRPQPNPKARKKLPPQVEKASLKEYFPDHLLLVGDNGEKWSYKLDIRTKNLTVTTYKTVESLKNCPEVKNLRIKEVYDVSLVTEKAEGIRVSANVLTALSDLGLLIPEKVDKTVVKPAKTKQRKEPAKTIVKPMATQHARSLTSDQYSYLAKQLLSDSVKAPACN